MLWQAFGLCPPLLRLCDHIQVHPLENFRISIGLVISPSIYLYLITHNTDKGQTSIPPAGFRPKILASERPQTHTLDLAAIGFCSNLASFCNTEVYANLTYFSIWVYRLAMTFAVVKWRWLCCLFYDAVCRDIWHPTFGWLTFRHQASHIWDRRTATPQITLFIYLVNRYT